MVSIRTPSPPHTPFNSTAGSARKTHTAISIGGAAGAHKPGTHSATSILTSPSTPVSAAASDLQAMASGAQGPASNGQAGLLLSPVQVAVTASEPVTDLRNGNANQNVSTNLISRDGSTLAHMSMLALTPTPTLASTHTPTPTPTPMPSPTLVIHSNIPPLLPQPGPDNQYATFRNQLLEKGYYLGDPTIRERVAWIRDGNAHRLVERASVGGASPPVAAVLSIVGEATASDFWLGWDGYWTPSPVAESITDTKLSFTVTAASMVPFRDDWEYIIETAHWIQDQAETPHVPTKKGFILKKEFEKLRFRHVLFKPISYSDDGDEIRDEDDEDNEIVEEWDLDTWPAYSPEAQKAMKELKVIQTHRVVPLLALDTRGRLIAPTSYRRSLEGAVVAVQFTLTHHMIRNKTEGKHDQFTADIHCIDVIRPPAPVVSTPQKRRSTLRTPMPSPSKRAARSSRT